MPRGSNRQGVGEASFRLIEHPADLGIEAWGPHLASAFEQAAQALISVIVDPVTVVPELTREVRVSASDQEQLLVRWLSELLYLVDGEGFVPSTFTIVTLEARSLLAVCRGEYHRPERHTPRIEVKAVTYHQLLVHSGDDGARLRVFLDI
jgi:SHS2 domain-containing protein